MLSDGSDCILSKRTRLRSFLVIMTEPTSVKIQHNKPSGFDEPNQGSDCCPDIDHVRATATNAANIMASVSQYKTGFFPVEFLVVISMTPVFLIMEGEHFDNLCCLSSTSFVRM